MPSLLQVLTSLLLITLEAAIQYLLVFFQIKPIKDVKQGNVYTNVYL